MYSPTPRKACTSSDENAFLSPQPYWCNAQRDKSFAYQEQAALRQDWNLALERNSQASTSAGPSPSLEDRSPLHSQPLSPACTRPITPSSEDDGNSEVHTSPELGQQRPLDKGAVQQTRKVFVGGITQSIDQNGLYKMFSKVGKVKKAWLQMFHADHPDGTCNKHRGFGFVIFSDEAAVENLLGGEWSKVVYLGGDGIRFEVKRAIGKVKETNVGYVKACPPLASQQSMPNPCPEPVLAPLPSVPPFPATPVLQWQPVAMVSSQALFPSSHWLDSFLPSILSEAFAEQRPRNQQELAWILRQVMPDRYEE